MHAHTQQKKPKVKRLGKENANPHSPTPPKQQQRTVLQLLQQNTPKSSHTPSSLHSSLPPSSSLPSSSSPSCVKVGGSSSKTVCLQMTYTCLCNVCCSSGMNFKPRPFPPWFSYHWKKNKTTPVAPWKIFSFSPHCQ